MASPIEQGALVTVEPSAFILHCSIPAGNCCGLLLDDLYTYPPKDQIGPHSRVKLLIDSAIVEVQALHIIEFCEIFGWGK